MRWIDASLVLTNAEISAIQIVRLPFGFRLGLVGLGFDIGRTRLIGISANFFCEFCE